MVEYFVMCTVIPLVGFNLLQNKNYLLTYLLDTPNGFRLLYKNEIDLPRQFSISYRVF